MTTPRFGQKIENTMASPDNPQRVGTFVRVIDARSRRMNAGWWWELTDEHGKFWQVKPANCRVQGQEGTGDE